MNNLLLLEEAAQKLNISKSTLRRLVATGKIKAIIISTRGDTRFSQEEIERFVKESTQK